MHGEWLFTLCRGTCEKREECWGAIVVLDVCTGCRQKSKYDAELPPEYANMSFKSPSQRKLSTISHTCNAHIHHSFALIHIFAQTNSITAVPHAAQACFSAWCVWLLLSGLPKSITLANFESNTASPTCCTYGHVRFVDAYKRERKDVDKIDQSQIHEYLHFHTRQQPNDNRHTRAYPKHPWTPLFSLG